MCFSSRNSKFEAIFFLTEVPWCYCKKKNIFTTLKIDYKCKENCWWFLFNLVPHTRIYYVSSFTSTCCFRRVHCVCLIRWNKRSIEWKINKFLILLELSTRWDVLVFTSLLPSWQFLLSVQSLLKREDVHQTLFIMKLVQA
jgi:hypothetical protein